MLVVCVFLARRGEHWICGSLRKPCASHLVLLDQPGSDASDDLPYCSPSGLWVVAYWSFVLLFLCCDWKNIFERSGAVVTEHSVLVGKLVLARPSDMSQLVIELFQRSGRYRGHCRLKLAWCVSQVLLWWQFCSELLYYLDFSLSCVFKNLLLQSLL